MRIILLMYISYILLSFLFPSFGGVSVCDIYIYIYISTAQIIGTLSAC